MTILKKRKREREQAQMAYKLVYTSDEGISKELSKEEFKDFTEKYPELANLIKNASTLINEE